LVLRLTWCGPGERDPEVGLPRQQRFGRLGVTHDEIRRIGTGLHPGRLKTGWWSQGDGSTIREDGMRRFWIVCVTLAIHGDLLRFSAQ
jgi:hypothetical protein